jgi:serine/threonine protein kinase
MSVGLSVAIDEPDFGTCATCGRTLAQKVPNGECLSCLVSLGFLGGSQQLDEAETSRRLTPGRLKYDRFDVDVGEDGFPIELGAGAMAITYRARDTVLNSAVALKIIDRSAARNPGVRSRFLSEARAAAQIRHPNVAHASHYGEQDGECFYVTELIEGETLAAQVHRNGPMPLTLALEVIEQAARALAATEACGIVHRDIKPSNIMLEYDAAGTLIVKVIDYGIAKVLESDAERGAEQTQTGFIGTPAFASPEQFTSDGQARLDTRSDIYSLGVTFWYLLSGRAPFVGRTLEDIQVMQTQPLPLEQLGLRIPTECLSLLKWMLAPDPADRPQSARELLSMVHRCQTKFGTEAESRRRRSAQATFGTMLIIAAIAAGVWLSKGFQSSLESERSIAVLPFEDLSRNTERSYIAIGLRDEIIDDLGRLADVKVAAPRGRRPDAAGKERNLSLIGRNPGVRYVLDGNIWKFNGEVWISLRLLDICNSDYFWSQTYDCREKDVFALGTEITRVVALQLQAQLPPLRMALCPPQEARPGQQVIKACNTSVALSVPN